MKLRNWDCIDKMKELENNSVDAIITDPPYWLSFMWKAWDKSVPSVEVWEECLRVLKPWWYLLAFAWTRTQHRMAVNIEDAWFEIKNLIAWIYWSWFPKSLNIWKAVDKLQGNEREDLWKDRCGKNAMMWWLSNKITTSGEYKITKWNSEWEWWGTWLKPALEPITVAQKPIEKWLTIAKNCLKWWVWGLNIDWSRVGTDIIPSQKRWNAVNTNFMSWWITPEHQWRFPANLVHDWSDEVKECFPDTKSWSIKKQYKQNSRFDVWEQWSWWNLDENNCYWDNWNASRYFKSIIYQGKASKKERNMWMSEEKTNAHPTVKPIALMEYLINMVSREWQTVLDPFMWSWTTWVATKNLNRDFIWIELDEEYFKICKQRLWN